MLKKLLLLSFLFISLGPLMASHLYGGEITVKVGNADTAYINMNIYKIYTPASIPSAPTITLKQGNISHNVMLNVLVPDSLNEDIEIYRWSGKFKLSNYNFVPGQTITATFQACCRNSNVYNISSSGSKQFVLESEFLYAPNSTPVFLNEPIMGWPMDSLWTYNPMPYDADGDSLYYSIDIPYDHNGSNTIAIAGYSAPSAHPGAAYSIDANGTVSYAANQLGNFTTVIQVEAFDSNGTRIGLIRRDLLQTSFYDSTSMNIMVANNNTQNINGLMVAPFTADSTGQLVFNLSTMGSNSALEMVASGEIFELNSSIATFSTLFFKNSMSTMVGTLEWTPTAAQVRSKPYLINIRFKNGTAVYDYTMGISVSGDTSSSNVSLSENLRVSMTVYPNPSSDGNFKVQAGKIEAGSYQVQLMEMGGRVIYQEKYRHLAPGEELEINEQLKPGQYILRLLGPTPLSQLILVE